MRALLVGRRQASRNCPCRVDQTLAEAPAGNPWTASWSGAPCAEVACPQKQLLGPRRGGRRAGMRRCQAAGAQCRRLWAVGVRARRGGGLGQRVETPTASAREGRRAAVGRRTDKGSFQTGSRRRGQRAAEAAAVPSAALPQQLRPYDSRWPRHHVSCVDGGACGACSCRPRHAYPQPWMS